MSHFMLVYWIILTKHFRSQSFVKETVTVKLDITCVYKCGKIVGSRNGVNWSASVSELYLRTVLELLTSATAVKTNSLSLVLSNLYVKTD